MTDKSRKNGDSNKGDSSRDLVKTWRENRPFFDGLKFRQIVSVAGDGELGDHKESSRQLRAFLGEVPLPNLRRYAEECLGEKEKKKFPDKGFALQDVVNQVGRRLGFEVEDGRYRGVANAAGQDGVWELPDGRVIVVEVKTTDAYRIELDTPADYQRALVESRPDLSENLVSVLLVVGRQDTGGLEAQIRGSRHAWDMRVISVDALLKIAEIKERVEEPTFQRIHEVLIPKEFTRLDEIAELVLSTARDSTDEETGEEITDEAILAPVPPPAAVPAKPSATKPKESGQQALTPFKVKCLKRAENELKARGEISADLIRRSRKTFSTPDKKRGVVCAVSRNHGVHDRMLWFGLSIPQQKFLAACERGWLVLGGDSGENGTVFMIPWTRFSPMLPNLRISRNRDTGTPMYSHVQIREERGGLLLLTKSRCANVDLSEYLLETGGEA